MTDIGDDPTVPVSLAPTGPTRESGASEASGASGADATLPETASAARRPPRSLVGADGPNAHRRPLPSLASLVAFLAGAYVVGGIVAIVTSKVKSHAQLVAFIVGAVLVVLGLAMGRSLQEDVRTAATVIGASGALAFVATAIIHRRWQNNRWLPVIVLLILSVVALVLWALPGLRDRTFLFGAGALLLQTAIITAVGVLALKRDEFSDSVNPTDSLVRGGRWVAVVAAATGAIMLVLAWRFAHADRQGLVTPLLLGGVLGGVGGATTAVRDRGDWVGIIVVLLSGIVVLFVGAQLHRRGTAWAGLALTGGGIAAALLKIWKTPLAAGIAAVVVGLVLLAVASVVRGIRSSAPTPEGFHVTDDVLA